MRAPDNIFTWALINIPIIEYLPTYRSWAIGNNSEYGIRILPEVCKIVPLPIEWKYLLMNKDLTPEQGLVQITNKITKWASGEIATVQPLVD